MVKMQIKFTEDDKVILEREYNVEEGSYPALRRALHGPREDLVVSLLDEVEDIINDKKGQDVL